MLAVGVDVGAVSVAEPLPQRTLALTQEALSSLRTRLVTLAAVEVVVVGINAGFTAKNGRGLATTDSLVANLTLGARFLLRAERRRSTAGQDLSKREPEQEQSNPSGAAFQCWFLHLCDNSVNCRRYNFGCLEVCCQMSPQEYTLHSAQSLEGQVLQQNYRIEKLVGKGGMAWVYQALHLKLKERLAVKVLQPDLVEDHEIRERFLSEGRVQFRMRHPHILEVTDLIEEGPWIGIVMEWVEGENLKQLLKRQTAPLSRRDLWRVMAPVLNAVGFAHEEGLVHRDIKPANILLKQKSNGEMVPKIADFGIAKIMADVERDLTSTGMTMGTLKYMAPEQIRDSKSVDHRADLYSLGVTMYMMSTLQPPFRGQQDYIIYQQLHEDPPLPSSWNPELSPAFDAVVMRCLAKEPEDRFDSCHACMQALSLALLSEEELPAPPSELGIFQLNALIDKLPESNSLYDSSIRPVHDSVLQPVADGAKASRFLGGSGVGVNNETSPSPTSLEPTLDNTPPQRWMESNAGQVGPKHTPRSQEDRSSGLDPRQSLPSGSEVSLDPSQPSVSGVTKAAFPTTSLRWWVLGAVVVVLGSLGLWLLQKQFNGTNTPKQQNKVGISRAVPRTRPKLRSVASCKEGDVRSCYTGKLETQGKGVCSPGKQTCENGRFGSCKGQVLPAAKDTCNGKDDDCDGQIDNGVEGVGKSCQARLFDCSVPGSFQCNSKAGRLSCVPLRRASRGVLHIVPSRLHVSLAYRGKRRRVRGTFCLALTKRTTVRLQRRGYYTCLFRMSPRKRPWTARLRRKRSGELAPLENYCVR
ncbi:MAG: serine/threonine protein kinase [Deltaproteobacteria bacterium]|nr:MAG: serine/threonine protein kinase [Deltaproteobacteria bacterium]